MFLQSSIRPITATTVPQAIRTISFVSRIILTDRAVMKATATATPPSRGVARAWIFLPPGLSTRPVRSAIQIISGVSSVAMEKEIRKM